LLTSFLYCRNWNSLSKRALRLDKACVWQERTHFPGHKCAQYTTVGGTRHPSFVWELIGCSNELTSTQTTDQWEFNWFVRKLRFRTNNMLLHTCIAGFVKGVRVRRGGQSASGSRRSSGIPPRRGVPSLPRAPQGHSAFDWSRLLARFRLNTTALPAVHCIHPPPDVSNCLVPW
jgi:hypothetical protein